MLRGPQDPRKKDTFKKNILEIKNVLNQFIPNYLPQLVNELQEIPNQFIQSAIFSNYLSQVAKNLEPIPSLEKNLQN